MSAQLSLNLPYAVTLGVHIKLINIPAWWNGLPGKISPRWFESHANNPPCGITIRDRLPNVKFIFPTASFRRSTVLKRKRITQWFDNFSLEDPSQRSKLQIDGLVQTSQVLSDLLRQETWLIGADKVILGGLSQGCAAMLIALLLWTGPSLKAAFGMSGWLPFHSVLSAEHFGLPQLNLDQDVFKTESLYATMGEARDPYEQAVRRLRNQLRIMETEDITTMPPLYLSHGGQDEKVAPPLGREASTCLQALSVPVRWHEYGDLAHGYSGEELRDLIKFLES